ncbi:hypothetical protein B5P46_25210 [Rhizobium leguminosarum]|uniref:Uncharacterized protein n=2 Tax=Rhizobium leguminosarum TaxID=384 RepID=A0A4V1P082_RHILE|nr:hypothetical protein B5P46_25210 [Rhizobium leguminosarum]
MLASRRHRLRHFLWHAVRGAWNNPQLTDEAKAFIRDKGWSPPDDRAPMDAEGRLILDNHSGEDFLYMHRQMIKEVNELLAQLGEPQLAAWPSIPRPADHPDFAVPPAWTYSDPSENDATNTAMAARLQRVKSDGYFDNPIAIWEAFFTRPSNLAQLSLGALGNMLEMTIHNNLHMRWAREPIGYMPSPNFDDTRAIDSKWDAADYDYLGDTYSSHVNPIFWSLHGWVDSCIDRWAAANRISDVAWVGTWTGKLEDGWTHGAPEAITTAVRRQAMGAHGHAHGEHGQDDTDLRDMEAIVQKLGSCRVIRNFYDLLRDPD